MWPPTVITTSLRQMLDISIFCYLKIWFLILGEYRSDDGIPKHMTELLNFINSRDYKLRRVERAAFAHYRVVQIESALFGYIIGFALKKIIKWLLIGLGVLAGIIFIVIQWMTNNGYIQGVKWDKLGNDISSYGQHLASQIDFNNLSGVFHYLGVPMTSGLAIGGLVGFLRTR